MLIVRKNNFVTSVVGIIVIFIAASTNSIFLLLLLFYAYAALVIYLNNNGTLSDPRLLLVGFFTFYSTFFAIRVYITGYSVLRIDEYLVALSLKYQLFGLVIFVVSLNFILFSEKKVFHVDDFYLSRPRKSLSSSSEKMFFGFLIPLVFLSFYFTFQSGANSKIEANQLNPIKVISDFIFWVLIAIAALRAIRLKAGLIKDLWLCLFTLTCFFYLIVTGERDIFFRLIFILLVVHFDKKRNASFLFLLSLMLSVALLVPVTQAFKAVLLSGNLSLKSFGLFSIFSNEFISAGRNFYSLVLFGVEHSAEYLGNDILRAFLPSPIAVDLGVQSTGSWFGSHYRVENDFSGSTGWGFTLIGQGYLVGGFIGIAIISFIYALIIGTLYNYRTVSIYWYVFYLFALATSIYILRADLANLLSQTLKIGGLTVFGLFIAHRIFVLWHENKMSSV
ncbi:O-antigen polymerase [Marinobacter sp. M5B]|uniref:O-antigen polymerase n=1 Tax=Marinobacter sp. M5B TaxID=3141535 RepID=UPI0036D3AD05